MRFTPHPVRGWTTGHGLIRSFTVAALVGAGAAVSMLISCGPVAGDGSTARRPTLETEDPDLSGLAPDEQLLVKALRRNHELAAAHGGEVTLADAPTADPPARDELAAFDFDPVPLDRDAAAAPTPDAPDLAEARPAIDWRTNDGPASMTTKRTQPTPSAVRPAVNNAWKLDDVMPLGQATDSAAARETLALTTPPPVHLDTLLRDLSGRLTKEAAGSDMPARELMLIAATSLVDPDHQLNVDQFTDLTERERQVLTAWHAFYRDLGREMAAVGDVDAVMPAALDKLRATLEGEPLLALPNAVLCTQVNGFGDFQPFRSNDFRARQAQQVVVYVEVANFESEQNPSGQWVTRLKQEVEIYRGNESRPIHAARPQVLEDVAKAKRKDYFQAMVFTIPDALSIDYYAMKIRVTDQLSGEVAETTIDFRIVD